MLFALGPRDLTDLQRACEVNEKDAQSCYLLGGALFTQARYHEAREPFEKALHAAPPEMRCKVHRAVALNFIGLMLPSEAETHFREAVRLYAGGTAPAEDPRIDYGAFLIRQGRANEARGLLQQAADSHPDSSRAHAELGKALLYAGQALKALASLEKAVALEPHAWQVRLLLGRAYLQAGRAADAERELRIGKMGWAGQNGAARAPSR